MAEELGIYEQLEKQGIVDFFDFEKYGESFGYDYGLYDDGYLVPNFNLDLNFYSKEEITEKAEKIYKENLIEKENIEIEMEMNEYMKLITKELEELFKQYPLGSQDGLGGNAKVIAKFFNPTGAGTWLITEAEKTEDGDYRMFGYCHLGYSDLAEFGYVMLSELEEIKLPFGLKIERDLYMPNDCNLIKAMELTGITPPDYLLENYEKDIEKEYDDYA